MKRVIKGYEKFKSKNGIDCCAIYCDAEYVAREGVQQVGTKVETVMCYGDSTAITKDAVGHELAGYFGYNKGQCVVQTPVVL